MTGILLQSRRKDCSAGPAGVLRDFGHGQAAAKLQYARVGLQVISSNCPQGRASFRLQVRQRARNLSPDLDQLLMLRFQARAEVAQILIGRLHIRLRGLQTHHEIKLDIFKGGQMLLERYDIGL